MIIWIHNIHCGTKSGENNMPLKMCLNTSKADFPLDSSVCHVFILKCHTVVLSSQITDFYTML